jgi:hypothetical protein
MNPSYTGHGRQNPSVNFKKKPDSEEDDKEEEDEDEEEEEEEEEIATALDRKEVSDVHIRMDACDHSKQGPESEIPPETQNDAESEVTDGCDPSKKALEKTEACTRILILMQMIKGPEPEIGTENQHEPESEVTKGGDTSTDKPGNSIGTEVISPGEGGSDDNSHGPEVLRSNPPLSGKALLYQQYLESKQNDTTMNVPVDNVVTDVIPPGGGGCQFKSDGPTLLPSNSPLCGNTLLYQQYLEKGKGGKYRTGKLASSVTFQCLYHAESEVTDGCDPSKKTIEKTEVCTRILILMQMIKLPNKDQNQRLVQKTNMDQNQKLQRVVILLQINQATVLELK